MLIYVNCLENDAAKLFFFHQKKRNYYLGNYKNYQPKNCGVKMREPKNKMLGTMVPPLCS